MNKVNVNITTKPIKWDPNLTIKGKKVEQIKVFKEKDLKKGDNYFMQISNKLRDYQIRKGKPIPLKNKWIEKKLKRADTIGEQRGLTIARYKAALQKQSAGLPIRKTKSSNNVKGFFGIK